MGTFWSTGGSSRQHFFTVGGRADLSDLPGLHLGLHLGRRCLNMVLGTLAVGVPARGGVGPRVPRGLCQPQPFCDSVKRRWRGDIIAAHSDLQESERTRKKNSSWWCQMKQGRKICKFLPERFILDSFFQEKRHKTGSSQRGNHTTCGGFHNLSAQSQGDLVLRLYCPESDFGLQTPKRPIPPPFPLSGGILTATASGGEVISAALRGIHSVLPSGTRPWFSCSSSRRTAGLRQPKVCRRWQDAWAFQIGHRLEKKSWYSPSDRGLPTGGTGGAAEVASNISSPGERAGYTSSLLTVAGAPLLPYIPCATFHSTSYLRASRSPPG